VGDGLVEAEERVRNRNFPVTQDDLGVFTEGPVTYLPRARSSLY